MLILAWLICIFIGYLIGCFQSSYFIGKKFANVDIRNHGSGNAGTTNTLRVLGKKAGAAVFTLDVLKGIIAYTLCSLLFDTGGTFFSMNQNVVLPGLLGGLGAVLGHAFPFYLDFKGGKGVACMLGIILSTNLYLGLILFSIGLIILATTRYMSLASMSIAFFFPIVITFFNFKYRFNNTIVTLIIACIIIYLHKDNISRLITKKERKFSFKKASKEEIK